MEDKQVIGTIIDKSFSTGKGSRGPWTKFSFKVQKDDDKTITLSTFDVELAKKFEAGNVASFTYTDNENNGKTYHNIKAIEAVNSTAKETRPMSSGGEQERKRLIVRQSCLSNALKFVELTGIKVGVKDERSVLELAEIFEKWVWREKSPEETIKRVKQSFSELDTDIDEVM